MNQSSAATFSNFVNCRLAMNKTFNDLRDRRDIDQLTTSSPMDDLAPLHDVFIVASGSNSQSCPLVRINLNQVCKQ